MIMNKYSNSEVIGVSFDIGDNWIRAYQFINDLLFEDILVIRNEENLYIPFEPILWLGNKRINQEDISKINAYADARNIKLAIINNLPQGEMIILKKALRIAVYGGGGSPYNYGYTLSEFGFDVYFVNDIDIRSDILDYFDVFIMPGGGFEAMPGQLLPLGEEGIQKIVSFVRKGGMYIGSCAGAYNAAITPKVFTDSYPLQIKMQMVNAKVWNEGINTQWEGIESPGIGVIKVKNCIPSHPVLWNLPQEFELTHYNGPIFDLVNSYKIEGASRALGLLSWSGYTEDFTKSEEFLIAFSKERDFLADKAIAEGKYASVMGYLDEGKVLIFGCHPEFGLTLMMDDIKEPIKLIANAILWHSSDSSKKLESNSFNEVYLKKTWGNLLYKEDNLLECVNAFLTEINNIINNLKNKQENPRWMSKEYSLSFFGKEPKEIWHTILNECENIIEDIEKINKETLALVQKYMKKYNDLEFKSLCREWYNGILYERPYIWNQDFGYKGILALLKTSRDFFMKAYENYDTFDKKPNNPYEYMLENPYHLAVGSYLSAAAALTSAKLLSNMYRSKLQKYLLYKSINS